MGAIQVCTVPVESTGAFENRLRKNVRRLRRWAERQGLTAYRLYDLDVPEHPYAVDWYDGRVLLVEYPRKRALREGTAAAEREAAIAAIRAVLQVDRQAVFVKTHLPKRWGEEQYQRAGHQRAEFTVKEQGLEFWVNLSDYLDTGLFLDHRPLRARVRAEAKGTRFLNLFAYTGSFTVYAAAGGAAETTTVDLSKTYLEWAERNLLLNGIRGPSHELVRDDAREFLAFEARGRRRFDLIVLDPPSFSASKAMKGSFEVQRDQGRLLRDALSVLAPGGTLYFSTNFLGFELAPAALGGAAVEELTRQTVPEDFRREVHRCWRIRHR